MQHSGVHVRCLLAIPLFIAGDGVAEAIGRRVVPYFVTSGLVTGAMKPRFVEILCTAVRWRDNWVAAVVIAVLAVLLAWRFAGVEDALQSEMK